MLLHIFACLFLPLLAMDMYQELDLSVIPVDLFQRMPDSVHTYYRIDTLHGYNIACWLLENEEMQACKIFLDNNQYLATRIMIQAAANRNRPLLTLISLLFTTEEPYFTACFQIRHMYPKIFITDANIFPTLPQLLAGDYCPDSQEKMEDTIVVLLHSKLSTRTAAQDNRVVDLDPAILHRLISTPWFPVIRWDGKTSHAMTQLLYGAIKGCTSPGGLISMLYQWPNLWDRLEMPCSEMLIAAASVKNMGTFILMSTHPAFFTVLMDEEFQTTVGVEAFRFAPDAFHHELAKENPSLVGYIEGLPAEFPLGCKDPNVDQKRNMTGEFVLPAAIIHCPHGTVDQILVHALHTANRLIVDMAMMSGALQLRHISLIHSSANFQGHAGNLHEINQYFGMVDISQLTLND